MLTKDEILKRTSDGYLESDVMTFIEENLKSGGKNKT